MSRFCFYIGPDPSTRDHMWREATNYWGRMQVGQQDAFHLCIADEDKDPMWCENANLLGAVDGYVRHDAAERNPARPEYGEVQHHCHFLTEVCQAGTWPLGEAWTGSFSAVGWSRARKRASLCNDVVGYLPLYYTLTSQGLIGGTSLILQSRLVDCEVDPTGVAQRITPPFANYGRRTLLRPVMRLLPGECLVYDPARRDLSSRFDNSLYQGVIDTNLNLVARQVWECLEREIKLAVAQTPVLNMALSGGWDSRLVLGGLRDIVSRLQCYTIGLDEHYETGIARRCAEAAGAPHRSCFLPDGYFPDQKQFATMVRSTEAANHTNWWHLLNQFQAPPNGRQVILVGDHCESIDGRNMSPLASREARVRSALLGLTGRSPSLPTATPTAVTQWQDGKRQEITKALRRRLTHLAPGLMGACSAEQIVQETAEDLELCFERVRANGPAFLPLYDELFGWLHKARFSVASQNLLLHLQFRSISPTMSTRALRLISKVHPRFRLRRRLMDALALQPELAALAAIPSAQIPWISARNPAWLREAIWAFRSGTDQVLLRRVLRTRDATKRQRVLRSLDYIAEYRGEKTVPRIQSWFSGRWLLPETYVQIARRRGELAAWPMANLDITTPANVSTLLDFCELNAS